MHEGGKSLVVQRAHNIDSHWLEQVHARAHAEGNVRLEEAEPAPRTDVIFVVWF